MKKLVLLSCCLMLSYTYSQAQIIVYCEAPAASAGNYAFTWADPAGGWGTADLNIPANSVKDTLMLVDDGTLDDSLGCNPLINDLTGKIAVVYRRTCEFGVKAKNAQDAGAVGVIIINHSGDPVGMAPGAQGANVTIPTVMVSTVGGAALRAQMDLGNPVVVFIGSKFGLYPNDLGFYPFDALTSRVTANPTLISANATEFNVPMGAWIHNYGNTAQSNVTLSAVISGAASYTASSAPIATLAALGDSAYATVPTYTATSYGGFYEVNYNVNYVNTDDFPADNSFYSNFKIDSLFSYTLFDAVTQMPKTGVNYGAAYQPPFPTEFRSCIHFRDPNASRLAALGIYASAGSNITLDITGYTIDALVYEWNNTFTGLSDAAFPATASQWILNEIGSGVYTYTANAQGQMVYIPFTSPSNKVVLADNQRYLFCQRTYDPDVVWLGHDNHYNYEEVIFGATGNDQPVSIALIDTNYYALGFGTDAASGVTVKLTNFDVSVNEHNNSFDVMPYPNPTSEFIRIPLKGMNGTAQLKIMDLNGKVVNAQTVKVAGEVTVNVTGISTGNYVFNMLFEDGRNTTFKVVITK